VSSHVDRLPSRAATTTAASPAAEPAKAAAEPTASTAAPAAAKRPHPAVPAAPTAPAPSAVEASAPCAADHVENDEKDEEREDQVAAGADIWCCVALLRHALKRYVPPLRDACDDARESRKQARPVASSPEFRRHWRLVSPAKPSVMNCSRS
jgi:hypothetical protein